MRKARRLLLLPVGPRRPLSPVRPRRPLLRRLAVARGLSVGGSWLSVAGSLSVLLRRRLLSVRRLLAVGLRRLLPIGLRRLAVARSLSVGGGRRGVAGRGMAVRGLSGGRRLVVDRRRDLDLDGAGGGWKRDAELHSRAYALRDDDSQP